MCPVEEILSCEIAFLPIGTPEYREGIKRVLDIIKESAIHCEFGTMSTTVKGEGSRIWGLLSRICNEMSPQCKFVMDLKVSNVCGCNEEKREIGNRKVFR